MQRAGLKNLDITSSHDGPILVSIVKSKLPDDIKLLVSRSMANTADDNAEWKIDKLMTSFKQEIESREMCNFASKPEMKNRRNLPSDNFTASSLFTGTTEDSPHISCVYCDKKHASWKCVTVTDVVSRKSILRKKGRCYIMPEISSYLTILSREVQVCEV